MLQNKCRVDLQSHIRHRSDIADWLISECGVVRHAIIEVSSDITCLLLYSQCYPELQW